MERDTNTSSMNRRDGGRVAMDGEVTVRFEKPDLVGPGQNISASGVFFVADEPLRVRVAIAGRDEEVPGELVRVQAIGEGKTGFAIRFDDPIEL